MKINFLKFNFIILVLLFLSACSSTHRRYKYKQDFAPNFHIDVSNIPNAVPHKEPFSKYGNSSSYTVLGHRYHVLKTAKGYDETGIASWYGMKFYNHKTSNGEEYSVSKMTAANKVLPLPTYVKVTNLKNGKWVIVRVNDRGPFHENRIIDLSYAAAAKLDMMAKGTALVDVKAIDPDNYSETVSEKPSVPIGHPEIYLQLGAFSIHHNADTLKTKLANLTRYPVIIRKITINHQILYRVQIGPISDVNNTDTLHHKIQQAGLGEPWTVIQ